MARHRARARLGRTMVATVLATTMAATGAASAADLSTMSWAEQNAWVLDRVMTPQDATRFLGVPGLVMTEGGEDRRCAASLEMGVDCADNWGGGSWGDAYSGQVWPAVALPRGVSVRWTGDPETFVQEMNKWRGTPGITTSTPTSVSGFSDHGGRYPNAWSVRTSGNWFVTAYCTPPVLWDATQRTYTYQSVPQASLADCAERLVREQFTKLGVTPIEIAAPGAPTGVLLSVRGSVATVTWVAPEQDGGAPITGYVATSSDGTLTCSSVPTSELIQTCAAPGAQAGVPYSFTVVASNAAGAGPASAPSRPSSSSARASAPRTPGVRVAGTSATLTWKRPASLGGLPLLRYVVTASSGSRTCTTITLSCTIDGLEYSTRYRFQIRAVNGRGASAPATTTWVRTPAAPAQPAPTPAPVPEPPAPPKPEQQIS